MKIANYTSIVLILCTLTICPPTYSRTLRIVSYNVENLFHPSHDSLTNDLEWTPDGERRWTYPRYYRKVENIARVLTNIGEWDGVDLVGLQEVENAICLRRLCKTLQQGEYDFIHYDSPDKRGIDVALIYKTKSFSVLSSRIYPVDLGEETTRDILYVCGCSASDTLHIIVCHLPSQRGGAASTQWKRIAAKAVLQTIVDSVAATVPNAKIILMGDMNSRPEQDINGLTNRMLSLPENAGSHKWQGTWTYLDQFYTSPAVDSISEIRVYNPEWLQEPDEKFLELKPKRTYNGFRYIGGYSDHLPIVMKLLLTDL